MFTLEIHACTNALSIGGKYLDAQEIVLLTYYIHLTVHAA